MPTPESYGTARAGKTHKRVCYPQPTPDLCNKFNGQTLGPEGRSPSAAPPPSSFRYCHVSRPSYSPAFAGGLVPDDVPSEELLDKIKNSKADDKPGRNGKSVEPMERLYRPSDKEPFMNERQRDYFRLKLLDWREEILKEAKETLQHLQDESPNHPDFADRASSETDRAIELRARDRQRKLIAKIDAALQRIEDGTYGYCEETGEPISIKRLEARPIATLSIEAQERHERRERVYRDD